MSLFEVKDWDVPSPAGMASSVPKSSKKRKRPANDAGKIHSAQVNVEKLMRKVETGGFRSRNEQKKGRRKGRTEDTYMLNTASNPGAKLQTRGQTKDKNSETEVKLASNNANPPHPKRAKKKSSRTQSPIDDALSLRQKKNLNRATEPSTGLTSLQASMKDNLEGARFRCSQILLSFAF